MDNAQLWITLHIYLILNTISVFFLAALYSFVELLANNISVRGFFKTGWGAVYIILNGSIGVAALSIAFTNELNESFVFSKIVLAGTSSLALLRAISLPIKINGNGITNNAVPMIEIVIQHVIKAYDRARSKIDLKDIIPIMKGIDPYKAAETLPVLCANLLSTLSEEEGKKMNEEISTLLKLREGNKQTKALNLGIILARYIGIDLLKNTVGELKEYILIDSSTTNAEGGDAIEHKENDKEIDDLIKKFS